MNNSCTSLATRAIDLTGAITTRFARWYQRRMTIRALAALDDTQLRDIAVARGQITAVAEAAARAAVPPWSPRAAPGRPHPNKNTRLATA